MSMHSLLGKKKKKSFDSIYVIMRCINLSRIKYDVTEDLDVKYAWPAPLSKVQLLHGVQGSQRNRDRFFAQCLPGRCETVRHLEESDRYETVRYLQEFSPLRKFISCQSWTKRVSFGSGAAGTSPLRRRGASRRPTVFPSVSQWEAPRSAR